MDRVVRAMTDDAAFRVVTLDTTKTAQRVLEAQAPDATTAESLVDLVTGVVLVRETMAPQLRVQAILSPAEGKGSLVADSHPSGKTRGLVSLPKGSSPLSASRAVLKLMRTLHDGRLHQGVVAIPTGKDVSEALMIYMKESEQIDTMIVVNSLFEHGELRAAGGYLVQLLPEVGRGPLAVMTERLEDFRDIKHQLASAFEPEQLLSELLHAMPHTVLGNTELKPGCWCTRTAVMAALSTLPRSEIEEMLEENKVLEISCDYCGRDYAIAPAELQGLARSS